MGTSHGTEVQPGILRNLYRVFVATVMSTAGAADLPAANTIARFSAFNGWATRWSVLFAVQTSARKYSPPIWWKTILLRAIVLPFQAGMTNANPEFLKPFTWSVELCSMETVYTPGAK